MLPPTPLSDEHDLFVKDLSAAGQGQQFFESCGMALTGVYDMLIQAFFAVGTIVSLPPLTWHSLSDLHRVLHAWRRIFLDTGMFFPASFALQFLLRVGLQPLMSGCAVPWASFAPLVMARLVSQRSVRRRLLVQVLPHRSSISLFTQLVETVVAASDEECPWPVYAAAPLFVTMFLDLRLFSPSTIKSFVDVCRPYAAALEEMKSWEAKALLHYYREAHYMSVWLSRMREHWLRMGHHTKNTMLGERRRQAILRFADDFSMPDVLFPLQPTNSAGDDHIMQVVFNGSFDKPQDAHFKIIMQFKINVDDPLDVGDVERAVNVCLCCGRCMGDVSFLACADCGVVQYCSKSCQTEHWRVVHHSQCKVLQASLVKF